MNFAGNCCKHTHTSASAQSLSWEQRGILCWQSSDDSCDKQAVVGWYGRWFLHFAFIFCILNVFFKFLLTNCHQCRHFVIVAFSPPCLLAFPRTLAMVCLLFSNNKPHIMKVQVCGNTYRRLLATRT